MSQKKAKFNIVDIIVIIVLIAGVAFVGVRMFGGQQPAAPATGDSFQVTFTAECVPEQVAALLQVDAAVENIERNMSLGKLADFTVAESIVYTADSKGELVQTTKPGYVSVSLVCELTGIEQPTGVQVGKYWLNAGHEMTVCCGLTEITAVITNIVPVN